MRRRPGVIYECGDTEVFMYPTPDAGTSKGSQAYWRSRTRVRSGRAEGARRQFEEYEMPGIKTKNSIATGGGTKTAGFKDAERKILAVSQRL